MARSNRSRRFVYVITGCLVFALVFLPLLVVSSVSIPFLYREKWSAFIALAYVQLSFLSVYMLIRVAPSEFWSRFPKRDRWSAIAGLVIGPLLLAYVLILLFPLLGNSLAGESVSQKFTYVSSEPYARTSRGLVQLKLVDDKGGENLVVFKKERVDRLAMKCGDTLTTVGRNSFLGYVIDSEAKAGDAAKQCPHGG
jgi:hypothetical protein